MVSHIATALICALCKRSLWERSACLRLMIRGTHLKQSRLLIPHLHSLQTMAPFTSAIDCLPLAGNSHLEGSNTWSPRAGLMAKREGVPLDLWSFSSSGA